MRERGVPTRKKPGRPKQPTEKYSMGLSQKVRDAIDMMVHQAFTRREAAEAVGMREHTLHKAFRNALVVRHYDEVLSALRNADKARSVHAAIAIRDKAFEDEASAAQHRNALDAAKWLIDGPSAPTTNVNIGIGVGLGYVIDLSGPNEAPGSGYIIGPAPIAAPSEPRRADLPIVLDLEPTDNGARG